MTIETVTISNLKYYLVSFDKDVEERDYYPAGLDRRLSGVVKKALKKQPITDSLLPEHRAAEDIPPFRA